MGALGWQATKVLTAAAANNIAQSQSPGAGAITLNGSLVSGGVATLDTPRRILLTSGGNDSGITFTVTGTNQFGNSLTETVTGGNTTAVPTTQDFKTVTSVTHTGSVAGTLTVGTNGVGSTPWYNLDPFTDTFNVGIGVVVSGTVNFTVQYTYDDANDPYTGTFPTAFDLSALASKTANTDGTLTNPCWGVRLTINSGTGTAKIVVIQVGIGGA